jgi:predicted glycosyltransferase
MYSHDTYGLGHIRRTMAIARHLKSENVNILILTGSPIAGRFSFPEQIDFVRIPGMIKKTNDEYLPLSIKINPRHALDIRKNIITTTAKAFKPHLFIVDKEPLGLKKEILPTLKWLQRYMPQTKTILGLRDIMDDAAVVQKDWSKKGVYEAMQRLYSEIWVYGNQEFYDPVSAYNIPESICSKIHFTGYIPRKVMGRRAAKELRREHRIGADDKLVVVTTGGGGDGFAVMDTYLKMLTTFQGKIPFNSILVTGPFMPKQQRRDIYRRGKRLGIKFHQFYRPMGKMLAAADLVVSMGGYNTVCEILSQKTLSLLIPRETPRLEQLLRAQVFRRQHLLDYIPWKSFTPDLMRQKVLELLEAPEHYHRSICRFRLTGIDTIRQRLQAFRGCKF